MIINNDIAINNQKSDSIENVIVLANGPGLADVDVEKIGCNNYCCVNYFPIKDNRFWLLRPKYLCLIDPAFFANNKTKQVEELLLTLEKISWGITIITFKGYKLNIQNKNVTFYYLSGNSIVNDRINKFEFFLLRHNYLSCGGDNVIVAAMYYFVMQKAKNIYLCGADMSEFKLVDVSKDNTIFINTEHFYNKEKVLTSFNKGELYKCLDYYVGAFKQLRLLSIFADKNNTKILNVTRHSYIDVFEKSEDYLIDYE